MKVFNCSHRHSIEPIVHQGSAIELIIPENCFIMFHCGLVHCGTPSWFICKGDYSPNTRLFFTIVEKEYNLEHEYTHQMETHLCNIDKCDVCKNNVYSTNEEHGPLIDLRKLKRSSAKINKNETDGKFHIINGNLNLLGWVVLKSKKVIDDTYDIALAKMSIVK